MQQDAWAALPSDSHLRASLILSRAPLPALPVGPSWGHGAKRKKPAKAGLVCVLPVLITLHFHMPSDLWDLRWVSLARLPGSCFWPLTATDGLVLPWEEDVCVLTPLGHTAVVVAQCCPGPLVVTGRVTGRQFC